MDFRTPVTFEKSNFEILHSSQMMLFGSCFSENIGQILSQNLFRVDVNPFGILYNPFSIAQSIRRLLDNSRISEDELVLQNGLYHSFLHHGDFSAKTKAECLEKINSRFDVALCNLPKADILLITFGTAFVYQLADSGEIVSNCHKFPASYFKQTLLSVDEIVAKWKDLLAEIIKMNPGIKVVFTVSPIRHFRNGFRYNQLSKATLILAVNKLYEMFPNVIYYFPAYEILMDDLRDYRYYADDMIHPSDVAIQYIWKGFSDVFFSSETTRILKKWNSLQKSLSHKPFNENSNEYLQFLKKTEQQLQLFAKAHPEMDCNTHIYNVKVKIDSLSSII